MNPNYTYQYGQGYENPSMIIKKNMPAIKTLIYEDVKLKFGNVTAQVILEFQNTNNLDRTISKYCSNEVLMNQIKELVKHR